MSTQPLEQAMAVSRGVLDAVTPEQMQASTPCESWDVAALINHMVGAQKFFTAGMDGSPPAEEQDYASGDYMAAFDEAAAKTVACFQAEGALERTVSLPFGDMPGSAFMGLAMTDTFQHSWDLAKATGQDTDLAPQLADGLLVASRQSISEGFRGPEGAPFGSEKQCPDGSCNADQLAAFLGREV